MNDEGVSARAAGVAESATLAVTAMAKKLKAEGKDVVSFAAGEPDFKTPAHICEAAEKAIRDGKHGYTPAAGTPSLRAAAAKKFSEENDIVCEADDVIVSPGAKYSLYLAVQAMIDPGDEVVIPTPAWVSYAPMTELAGGVPVPLPTSADDGFAFDADALREVCTDKTRLLVLNSPSNPTGGFMPPENIRAVAAVLEEKGVRCISDEIYEKLVYDGVTPLSIASTSDWAREHTVTVNGVSKAYAMTGWRIGYAVGPRTIIKAMGRIQSQSTSNPCAIAQAAAEAALTGPQDCVEEMRAEFASRRDLIVSGLNDIPGVSCFTPKGAFYAFPRVADLLGREYAGETADTDLAFCTLALREKLIAMVPGEPFGAPGYLRMSYACGPDDIKQGLERLRAFVS